VWGGGRGALEWHVVHHEKEFVEGLEGGRRTPPPFPPPSLFLNLALRGLNITGVVHQVNTCKQTAYMRSEVR